jgi:transcriptional antiterminator NusG
MAAKWYVLHVYSGFENKVAQSIREQAATHGMTDKIQEVIVPMEKVAEVRRGKPRSTPNASFSRATS